MVKNKAYKLMFELRIQKPVQLNFCLGALALACRSLCVEFKKIEWVKSRFVSELTNKNLQAENRTRRAPPLITLGFA